MWTGISPPLTRTWYVDRHKLDGSLCESGVSGGRRCSGIPAGGCWPEGRSGKLVAMDSRIVWLLGQPEDVDHRRCRGCGTPVPTPPGLPPLPLASLLGSTCCWGDDVVHVLGAHAMLPWEVGDVDALEKLAVLVVKLAESWTAAVAAAASGSWSRSRPVEPPSRGRLTPSGLRPPEWEPWEREWEWDWDWVRPRGVRCCCCWRDRRDRWSAGAGLASSAARPRSASLASARWDWWPAGRVVEGAAAGGLARVR